MRGFKWKDFDKFCRTKVVGVAIVFLFIPLTLDSILLSGKSGESIKVNIREDIVLSQDFINPSVRLSYTLTIANTVDRIRAQNVAFERDALIPKAEQLEYCFVQNNFHICTDNNYPVIWRNDGTVEVQESSRNKDLWLTINPEQKQPTEIDFDEFCYTSYPGCQIPND